MLTKTAIYKKYASLEEYQAFCDETIQSLKAKFPNVEMRSFSEFKKFLDSLVPKLVHKYLISTFSMKNCSGISPDFAEIAAQAGFPVLVNFVPGHQRNIVLTTDGPYVVDLSYIQFTCNHDWSDKESRDEVRENYRSLYRDPFSAISIERLPYQYLTGTRLPQREYHVGNPDPMESIQNYDIERTEEMDPGRYKMFK